MARANDCEFPSTHWTLVGNACRGTLEERRRALGLLLERYRRPLKAYVRRRWGTGAQDAEDLVHDFILGKVIEQDLLAHADPSRGRFRGFLQSVLDRRVLEGFRRARRQKRGGGTVQSIEEVAELVDDREDLTVLFDVEWARGVIEEAAGRMRRRCEATGRRDLWSVLEARVLGPTLRQEDTVSYRELVARFRFESLDQASNALVTAKRMFVRALHSVVGEYASGEAAIDEEIADLRRILASR